MVRGRGGRGEIPLQQRQRRQVHVHGRRRQGRGRTQNHRQQESAKIEAARIAQQQRELAAERANEEAELMARVDSDIARQVPSALEPLASLMDENQGTGN